MIHTHQFARVNLTMAQPLASDNDKQKQEWKTEADSVWQFGLLAAPNLGEYGGGDGLKLSCPLLVMKLASSRIPTKLMTQLPSHINSCITINNKIPKDKRVARLPEKLISSEEFLDNKTWTKTCHFELQSHVPLASSNRYNIMYQGWLFKEIPNDPNRLGCSLFPLVGVYNAKGLIEYNDTIKMHNNDEILHYAGYNKLQWADQHCHLDFGAWHFGSDMSKIIVNKSLNINKFWSVCVDVENKKVDVSLVYIINDMLSSQIEGMLRNCDPHLSVIKAKEFFDLFTAVFMEDIDDNMKGELSDLLFGGKDDDGEDEVAMKEKLKELVTEDKQKKMQEFVKNEDGIRDIKDKSSGNLIEGYGHSVVKDDKDENKKEEMEQKLQELVAEDKQKRMEKFIENEDKIRDIKDESSKNLIEPNAFNQDGNEDDNKMEVDNDNNDEQEQELMKDKLKELVTEDKQKRLGEFVENNDEIRNIKDESTDNVLQSHGHSEMDTDK